MYWETYIAPYIDPVWKKISPYVLPVYNDLHKAVRMWWKALKSGDINRIKKGTDEWISSKHLYDGYLWLLCWVNENG